MKKCSRCEQTKPLDDFNNRAKSKDGKQSWCRECQREKGKDRDNKAGSRKYITQQERLNKNRQWLFDYLQTHPCVDCGESDPIVLEFDHQDDKVESVSIMVQRGFGLEKIKAEIAKCEVRCANCHRRKTAKQLGWYQY